MKNYRWYLVLALAVAVAVLTATRAVAQEELGSIFGVVFHDLDGDGVRDEGEPGLAHRGLHFRDGDPTTSSFFTRPDGSYRIDNLAPGEYVLEAGLDGGLVACGEYLVSFNPLSRGYCFHARYPWNATTDNTVPVTVESGTVLEIDFGGQPADVAVVLGNALLEDDFAPPGTVIEALVNGQECGSTTVRLLDGRYSNGKMFELHILGEGERAGCASTGDPVHFLVGGVPVAETFTWLPFIDSPRMGYVLWHLVAMQQRAWYWFETTEGDLPAAGTVVQAVVDGNVCGETTITPESPFPAGAVTDIAGFWRLIVPSETVQSGCGRPGATVSFLVAGVEAEIALPWEPGLQRIDLVVPEPPTPALTPSPELPDTGQGPGGDQDQGVLPALTAVLVAGGALLVGGRLLLARQRIG